MAERPYVWLTRPQADSASLANALAAHGIPSIISPVMDITPIAFSVDATHKPDGLLLTSRHAADALGVLPTNWRTVPVFCVGAATANAARAAGYATIVTGGGDALALLPHIKTYFNTPTTLLHLSGEDTRHDMEILLNTQQIKVKRIVVYKAEACLSLDDALVDAARKNQLGGTAFFSPRSAELAHNLLQQHDLIHTLGTGDAYCLSLAVAEAAACMPWQRIHACHRPTREAMVDLIVSRYASML